MAKKKTKKKTKKEGVVWTADINYTVLDKEALKKQKVVEKKWEEDHEVILKSLVTRQKQLDRIIKLLQEISKKL